MVSSELPEVLGMSDRIIVMHEGEMTAEFSRDDADSDRIILAATVITSYSIHYTKLYEYYFKEGLQTTVTIYQGGFFIFTWDFINKALK